MPDDFTPPYLEQKGDARYLIAAPDRAKYRVYDVVFDRGKHRPVTLMSRRATARIFRPQDGWWRIYKFADGDKHHLDVFTLQTQLMGAEYLQRDHVDTSDRLPR